MTASLAIIGYGTRFQTGDTSSPIVYTSLAEVRGLAFPPLSVDVVDAGHECAPDEWREVLTGLKTAGELSLEMNFHKSSYQLLFNELGTRIIKPRRVLLVSGTHLDFDGWLTKLEATFGVGDLVSAVAGFRASGEPTLTVV